MNKTATEAQCEPIAHPQPDRVVVAILAEPSSYNVSLRGSGSTSDTDDETAWDYVKKIHAGAWKALADR